MPSKITGRTENFYSKLTMHPKGSLTSPKETTFCPNCGWVMHPSLSSSYPFNYCVKCGYPVKFARVFKDLDGFEYIDHETGFRINVGGPGDTTIRVFNRIVDIEELRQFVKKHGRKI